ncbi:MAG: sulfonate transport system substrate-binding protein [Abditibacteriota bacterium]|nr:sulfonate transport system substrate-binding protein [Abditibacteriota bacterium]
MKRRYLLNWLAGAAATLIVAGCGNNGTSTQNSFTTSSSAPAGNAAQGSASEIQKITIGYLPNIVMPQPLIGLVDNEFARQVPGVSFASKDYPAGPAVLEALRAGVVDIAYTGPYPPIKAYAKDKDIVLLAGAGSGGTELLVAQSSPIKSVKELKGKIVGVNQLGSTVDALVRYNLIKAGLQPDKDVQLVAVPPAEQAEALKADQVQAVASPAPWPSTVRLSGGRALLDWKQILDNGNYLQGVVFTTRKFAEANPNFIKQFVTAHRAITDRLNKDRTKGDAQVLAAWSKVTGASLKPDVAKAAFATIIYTNEADQKSLERDMKIAAEVGILRKTGDLTGFVYTE